jgi:hypothetical protein
MAAKTKTSTSSTSFQASVAKLVTATQAVLTQLAALGLPSLTAEERLHSNGRLRVGEDVALQSILATMGAFPGVFQSLAAQDGGSDDTLLETAPALGALARGQALQPLAALTTQLAQAVSDGVLASFSAAKDVTVPAYAIGKVNAGSNAGVRKALAPAIDFYGAQSRKRALDTKVKATRAAKATKAGKTAST